MIFIDLKAAFDKVARGLLWNTLKKIGINRELIWRIKKIYKDTEAIVRTEDGLSRAFRTTKNVRDVF